MTNEEYERLVQEYIEEGMSRGDAQGIVDMMEWEFNND